MFNTPYDTTPLKDHRLENIMSELLMAKIDGSVVELDEMPGVFILNSQSSKLVPIFTQPLTSLQLGERAGDIKVVFDGRALTRVDGEGRMRITNTTDYDLQKRRASLLMHWINPSFDRRELLRAGDFSFLVFTTWITRTLTSKFALDGLQSMNVNIITGWYYICQFVSYNDFDDETREWMNGTIQRWTRIPYDKVVEVTTNLNHMDDIKDYIEGLKKASGTVRFDAFSFGVLYALLGSGWFGPNSRETVCVALEHPPTFIALLVSAVQLKSFKSTVISKVAISVNIKTKSTDWVRNIEDIINTAN